jgi:methionyl-tRNA formyltransferase
MKIILLGNFPPVRAFVNKYVEKFLAGTDIEVQAVVARTWSLKDAAGFFKRYQRRQKQSPDFYRTAAALGKPPKEIFFTKNFNSPDLIAKLKALEPDLFVFMGGMDILKAILDVPKIGTLAAHYGKLPETRGVHTLEWSILLGKELGVSIQFMEKGIDIGDIMMFKPIPIEPNETIQRLRDKASFMARQMTLEAMLAVQVGTYSRRKQTESEGKQFFRMHPYLIQTVAERLNKT